MIHLDELWRESRALTLEEFLGRFSMPFLYVDSLPAGLLGPPGMTAGDEASGDLTGSGAAVVYPVAKLPGRNAFTGMVTVGRVGTNDIMIPLRRISNFHAYLRRVGEGWQLFDAKSSHGTAVDGQRLAPEQGVDLVPHARIDLANSVTLEFLPAPAMHRLLQGFGA